MQRSFKPTSYGLGPCRRHGRAAGFTLVEMLVVIGIILVLLAMLLPAVNYMRRQADRKNVQADFQTIGVALDEYKKDHGDYPRPSMQQPLMPVLAWALVGSPEMPHSLRMTPPASPDGWDGSPGPGFRTFWTTNSVTGQKSGSRVWGPYIDPDKFVKSSSDFPNTQKLYLLDRFGGPIEYFPRWRLLPKNANANLFGTTAPPPNTIPGNNFYDYRQMYWNGDPENYAPDGGTNVADNNTTPLHYLRKALGDNNMNDKVEPAAKEVWKDTPPYILLSRGPLRKFSKKADVDKKFDKCLEITNLSEK